MNAKCYLIYSEYLFLPVPTSQNFSSFARNGFQAELTYSKRVLAILLYVLLTNMCTNKYIKFLFIMTIIIIFNNSALLGTDNRELIT